MSDMAKPSQLSWPAYVIEQATGIIMQRFELDAEQALKLLRKMSQSSRTQMCIVAQQIIQHNAPEESAQAECILFMAAHDFPEVDA
jgi:hypothetical protein